MVVHQQQRKGRWMPDEDKLLIRLVRAHGDGEDIDWSTLEQNFNGTRDSKQIRERWVNHLNPSIKKRKFNDKEIEIIEEECSKHKFKWAKIAKKIPNATPLMIKNFYNNRLKKKNPANRRLSNANTTTSTYTINDFNNITTTTNNTDINFNLNNNSNNNNYNCYNNNEYRPAHDVSYYSEFDLSRDDNVRTSYTPSLSRNSSVKTSSSLSTMSESSNNFGQITPRPSAELGERDNLILLAKTADFVSTVEHFPTDNPPKPKKAEIMALSSILNH